MVVSACAVPGPPRAECTPLATVSSIWALLSGMRNESRMDEGLSSDLVVTNLEAEGLRRGRFVALGGLRAHPQRDVLLEIGLVHRMAEANRRDDLVDLGVGRVLVELGLADRRLETW